jgi:hypothetical protein
MLLTFAIDTAYDGTFDATALLRMNAQTLNQHLGATRMRLFFGGSRAETTFDDFEISLPVEPTECLPPGCWQTTPRPLK